MTVEMLTPDEAAVVGGDYVSMDAARLKKAADPTLVVAGVPPPSSGDNAVGSVVVTAGSSTAGSAARSHA